MRKAIIVLVGVILAGCQCRRCEAQTPKPVWVADLTVNASEQAEFRELVYDLANQDLGTLVTLLYQVATGATLDTTPDAINTAQHNRWFNPTDKGSFMAQAHLALIRKAVRSKGRVHLRPQVLAAGIQFADSWVTNAEKKQKYLLDLARLGSEESVDY